MSLRHIISILKRIRVNAYVPDSSFSFSALIKAKSNICTVGVNWENIDRSIGCCAETSAIMNMISCEGPVALSGIYLLGGGRLSKTSDKFFFPCSECRQFIEELNEDKGAHLHQIALNGKTLAPVKTISLMRDPFIFQNYIRDIFKKKTLVRAPASLRGMKKISSLEKRWIKKELKNAAARSFSPDESYAQGAIILTEAGYAYCGSSFNTANFKSSKNAITAALSMMISFDGPQRIREAYFLHEDNRRFFSGSAFFPREMQAVLGSFGCRKITIFSGGGEEVISDFTSLKDAVIVARDAESCSVPRRYRGL